MPLGDLTSGRARGYGLACVLISSSLPTPSALFLQPELQLPAPAAAAPGPARGEVGRVALERSRLKNSTQRTLPSSRRARRRRTVINDACYKANLSSAVNESCVDDEPLLFLHIPKNAGSAIEEEAHKQGIKWGKYMDFDGCALGQGSCSVHWHEPPALMSRVNVYSASSVFCVVRNPFSRALSEYKYVYENPEFRWSNNELIQVEGCSSYGLNEWMARILKSFLGGETFEQLCHILPQSYFIWGPPDIRGEQCQYCHEIIRLEDFPNSFNTLMERYDYSVRLNQHKHTNTGGCSNLRPSDINATNRDMIRTIYESDFQLLNYSTHVAEAE